MGCCHRVLQRSRRTSGGWAGPCGGVCLLLVGLSACDSRPKSAGQVAAQVNGAEITVHEVNRRLVNLEVPDAESVPAVRREILDELIDRELLLQRALAMKLDREPDIMRAVEQAKEGILADAVVDRGLAGEPEATPQQVQSFLVAHPELFGKRRIYHLAQFTIGATELVKVPTARLEDVQSAGDVERLLKDARLDYRLETVNRAAEQLPMELASRLLPLSRGDVVTFSVGDKAQLIYIQDFQEDPVDERQADGNIREYLRNVAKQRVLDTMLKQLRQQAEITYLDGFEQAPGGEGPAVHPVDAEKQTGVKAALPAPVERGVPGLVK